LSRLKPVFCPGGDNELFSREQDMLLADRIIILLILNDKAFLHRIRSREIEKQVTFNGPDDLFLSRVRIHRWMPVFGYGLVGKQDKYLSGDPFGIEKGQDLYAFLS
jgi:hypothetical protein